MLHTAPVYARVPRPGMSTGSAGPRRHRTECRRDYRLTVPANLVGATQIGKASLSGRASGTIKTSANVCLPDFRLPVLTTTEAR